MTDTAAHLAAALAGRYRIERELGHGGMATVYLAHDLKHDRPVAIKVLRPELSAILGPERFAREIRITGQLSHPNILQVFDSGEDTATGLCWYTMPYVEGESLRDLMKRETQLPIDEALKLFGEIADGLDHAHRHGFVHRDLKPENILLQDGHARVADFGIARTMSAVGSEKLTETGLALGTPHYMSPEQAAGMGNLDARSDVYALGCLLYEMLAGNPPFQGPTVQAIMARHAVDPVPGLRTVRGTVPPAVEAAITKALAKVPADRFTSAAQFVEAFSKPVPALRTAGVRGRATGLIAGAAIALALAVGGWLFARSHRPQVEPNASVIAVLPFGTSGDTALTRLSHDLVLTVSASLDGVGGIRTADAQKVLSEADDSRSGQYLPNAVALGKRLGAGSVVVGSLVRQGPRVQLDLKLVATKGDSEPLARVTVTNSPDSVTALTDSITWALLRQVWRRGEPPSASYANLTTRSVLSLRAFLDGERLSAADDWSGAADAYAAAIKADSSFWLAGWRYNNTQGWLFDGKGEEVLTSGYESHLSSFGERDRLLIQLDMDGGSLLETDYLARLRAIVKRFPDDWTVWFKYADALHHWGPMIGVTNAEIRAALQRTVDLNPKLVPMWNHLFEAAAGYDTSQVALVMKSMAGLGYTTRRSAALGYDATMRARLLLAAGGPLPVPLRDSFAVALAGSTDAFERIFGSGLLHWAGYPAAQLELNQRLIALDPHGPLTQYVWENTAYSWAARGAWDSTLIAFEHWAKADQQDAFDPGILPLMYEVAVAGAWLGGLDTARAAGRRPAAMKYVAGLLPDSAEVRKQQGRIAWADGMLAVLRRDLRGLAQARERLREGGGANEFRERSLAGFDLELRGQKQAAAESLAALDLAATDSAISGPHDPYARSITHLEASRLLLEQGDTARAVKLLAWHESNVPMSPESFRSEIFAGLAYYELARIEEAQGKNDLALDHYQQFLRRYDMPSPAHQRLVDEARASLRKLNGLNDAPAPN